ncbi:hypothetical protein ACP93_14680 [Xanthomonas sp. NCPPB 1128]|nr:hypothetical protein ACP93_14680 [Xanthomonas sp. NCPPB 1128]
MAIVLLRWEVGACQVHPFSMYPHCACLAGCLYLLPIPTEIASHAGDAAAGILPAVTLPP